MAKAKEAFDPWEDIGFVPYGDAEQAFAFYKRAWEKTEGQLPLMFGEALIGMTGDETELYFEYLAAFHDDDELDEA